MRGLFSFVGLVVVLAILAVIARKQLQGTVAVVDQSVLPAASAASGTFQQRASAVPQQVGAELNQLMQQRPGQIDGADGDR